MRVSTRRWWKRGMAVGMLLLTAVMLSACIDVNQQSTIGSDFKGTTTMKIGISKVFLQTISTIGSNLGGTPTPNSGSSTPSSSGGPQDDPFADLTKQVTGMGGTATPYDDGNFMGVQIMMPFSSLDEMQKQINTLLGSSSASGGGGPSAGSSGSDDILQITAKDTGSSVRIDGKVNPLDLSAASTSSSSSSSSAGLPPGLDLSSLIAGGGQVQLSFTMPGKIQSADTLAKQSGNTVSWSFKVGDKAATIFVESDKS